MNFNEIVQDPDFVGLPQPEQLKVLSSVDPDFAGLPQPEQIKVLGNVFTPEPVATPANLTRIQRPPEQVQPQDEGFQFLTPENMPIGDWIPSKETVKSAIPYVEPVADAASLTAGGILGFPAGGPAGSVVGAGTLFAAQRRGMDALKQYLGEQQPYSLPEGLVKTGKDVMEGATAEMTGQSLFPALAPVAKAAGRTAEAMGLPQLAYKERPWLKSIVESVPGGKWMVERYENKFNQWALGERSAIIDELLQGAQMPTKTDAGQMIGEELKGIAGRHKAAYGEFQEAGTKMFEGKPVDIAIPIGNDTAALAHQYLPSATGKTQEWLQKIVDDRTLTAKEISQMLGGTKAGGVDPAIRKPLKDSIQGKDLVAYDDAADTMLSDLMVKADGLYSEWVNGWAKNPAFVKGIRAYEPTTPFSGIKPKPFSEARPDKVVDAVMRSGSIDDAKAILEAMPEDLKNLTLARWMQNELTQNALNSERTMLLPTKWGERFSEIEPRIKALAPDSYERVKNFTDIISKAKELMPSEAKQVHPWERLTKGGLGLGLSVGGASVFAGGVSPSNPAFLLGFGAINGLPAILAWKFLGPAGTSTLRTIGASQVGPLLRSGATIASMEGQEALK